jgi:molybdopterin-guanine dinucleotide biosynthesis protein A
MINLPLNGLVLAGGRSVRMGADKSSIRYFTHPQHLQLANLLASFCQEVFISGRHAVTGYPVLADAFGFEGPLNGILTAFKHQPEVAWLTVPVDMPNIDADLIGLLMAGRNPEKMATCFFDSTGKQPEPLLALWEPAGEKKLTEYFTRGGRSPREFLMTNPVELLTVPHPKYLININTPADLSDFRKTLQRKNNGE